MISDKEATKIMADALNALFPSKRYAPHKSVDSGCPSAPQEDDKNE